MHDSRDNEDTPNASRTARVGGATHVLPRRGVLPGCSPRAQSLHQRGCESHVPLEDLEPAIGLNGRPADYENR